MQPCYLPFDTDLDGRYPGRTPVFGESRLITWAEDAGQPLLILDERGTRRELGRTPDHRDDPHFRDRLIVVLRFEDKDERDAHLQRVYAGVTAARRQHEEGSEGDQEPPLEDEGGTGVAVRRPTGPVGKGPGIARTFAEAQETPRSP